MNDQGIGKLERVALRQVWKHEAYDFTRWLQTNIDVLNEVTGLTLINVEREQSAGSFNVDLVAEDDAGGKIIIENQLEKSNHDHLGKLITYLAAVEARAAVWIVSEPRAEHVSAISWLNDSSSAHFYLVKVEAVRIGASPPAPLLTLIVGPSEQAEEVARTKREFNDRYEIRSRWWSSLLKRPDAKLHSHLKAPASSLLGTSSGVPGVGLNYALTQDQCSVELYIDRVSFGEQENKSIYDQLYAQKDEIEKRFGGALNWQRLDGKRACRIGVRVPGCYRSPENEWSDIQANQVNAMNRLEAALRPCLQMLKVQS